MHYDWNFGRLIPYAHAFAYGTLTTLTLTILVIIFGTILGFLIGFALRVRPVAVVLYPFVDVVRAVPPLVLLLFSYYFLTVNVIGIAVPAYWVYVVAMSINLAAFTADLVRSASEAIAPKIVESGMALGMSDAQVLRHIYLPYLLRSLIPAMTAIYIAMLKMSSLASVINVAEVVYAAETVIADIARSLEAWVVVAAIYIVIVVPLTYLLRHLEKISRRGIRPGDIF